jgi:methionyl-tRNA synthetase
MTKKFPGCDPKKLTCKEFDKFEFRVAQIKAAKPHDTKPEYILALDLWPVERDIQVVADLKESYKMEELIGKQCIVILNVCPETVDNVESTAMILLTMHDGKPRLISPDEKVEPGVKVYGALDGFCTHIEE